MLTAAQTRIVAYQNKYGEMFHLTCHEIHDKVTAYIEQFDNWSGPGWYDATLAVAELEGSEVIAVSLYDVGEASSYAVESDVEYLEQGLDPTMFESLTGQTIEDAVIDHDTFGAVRCAECGEVI